MYSYILKTLVYASWRKFFLYACTLYGLFEFKYLRKIPNFLNNIASSKIKIIFYSRGAKDKLAVSNYYLGANTPTCPFPNVTYG